MRSWFFDIISILGFFLTGLGTYLALNSGTAAEVLKDTLTVASMIGFTLAAILAYRFYHKASIRKSVIEGREKMQEALLETNNLKSRRMTTSTIQKDIQSFSGICQLISSGMRKFHRPDISVCIQYVNKDAENSLYVKTLCRNVESTKQRERQLPSRQAKDYIGDNTDFRKILSLIEYQPIEEVYYLGNFLPFHFLYQNSHFYERDRKRYDSWRGPYFRIFHWNLPYKSTLVLPIVIQSDTERNIVGFLSLDSPWCWSFSKEHDLPILLHLAQNLAPVVAKFVNLNFTNNENKSKTDSSSK